MTHVFSLGCIMRRLGWGAECGGLRPVEVHHLREGQGAQQRSSPFLTIPVCTAHHTGAFGIHKRKEFYRRTKLEEMDLLAATLEALEVATASRRAA